MDYFVIHQLAEDLLQVRYRIDMTQSPRISDPAVTTLMDAMM